jgi:hypothetical protein
MNIVDAVLCADVIEDARLEGGLMKIRAKLNQTYGKIDTTGITEYSEEYYETLERQQGLYTEEFYAKLESGQLDDSVIASQGVELSDEGLPGIPVMG